MRAKCIDRPQLGQAGPALIEPPAGRVEFCMTNMGVPHDARLGAFLNARLKFKQPFETRSRRK
jgi:hypothetical protein